MQRRCRVEICNFSHCYNCPRQRPFVEMTDNPCRNIFSVWRSWRIHLQSDRKHDLSQFIEAETDVWWYCTGVLFSCCLTDVWTRVGMKKLYSLVYTITVQALSSQYQIVDEHISNLEQKIVYAMVFTSYKCGFFS